MFTNKMYNNSGGDIMRILRKPLSILLSLIMILSVFTIIPMTTVGAA